MGALDAAEVRLDAALERLEAAALARESGPGPAADLDRLLSELEKMRLHRAALQAEVDALKVRDADRKKASQKVDRAIDTLQTVLGFDGNLARNG